MAKVGINICKTGDQLPTLDI